jgi:3-hydroxyisobutyrate dehydrogenase
MKTVTFIGVGGIGKPMAERLIDTGFAITVCDVNEAALEAFRRRGARTISRAAEGTEADAIIVMVANDAQVKAAVLGPGGVLEGIDPQRPPVVTIMSSVLPQTIQNTAREIAKKNVHTLDAPVSGGSIRAAHGELTIMVGGDAADMQTMRPVFDALGNKVFHCGPLGSAEAVKIINNIVGVANTLITAEALEMAIKLGIDLKWLADVMEASSGRNVATKDIEGFRSVYRYNAQTAESFKAVIDICRKDLILGQTLAKELNVFPPILHALALGTQPVSYDDILATWRAVSEDKYEIVKGDRTEEANRVTHE